MDCLPADEEGTEPLGFRPVNGMVAGDGLCLSLGRVAGGSELAGLSCRLGITVPVPMSQADGSRVPTSLGHGQGPPLFRRQGHGLGPGSVGTALPWATLVERGGRRLALEA